MAQQILRTAPITELERSKVRAQAGGAPTTAAPRQTKAPKPQSTVKKQPCKKNQRKFWALLTYTRFVSWGKEFTAVGGYILQNTLEALNLIAYQPRKIRKKSQINFSTA